MGPVWVSVSGPGLFTSPSFFLASIFIYTYHRRIGVAWVFLLAYSGSITPPLWGPQETQGPSAKISVAQRKVAIG